MSVLQFKVELPLQQLVEDIVSKQVLQEVLRRKPVVFDGSHLEHEEREQLFDTLFDKVMENVTARLKVDGWSAMKLSATDSTLIIESVLV